jgi:chromosome partitioning protein
MIAADAELETIEQKLESRHKIYKLRDLLNKLESEFDQVFIDTAPAFNFYTMSALVAADTVLIPFDCDAFSRQALYNILGVVAETREDHNDNLSVEGIVVNQFQARANLPTQIIEELKAEGQPVIPIFLNSSIKMRESHQSRKPLIHMAPSHPLTLKFVELYDYISPIKQPTKRVHKQTDAFAD